jgi:sulfur-oxidizing protein SoxZ
MARVLINVPPTVKRGAVFQIKTLINHTMEPGFRPGADGKIIPRDIITLMTCKYNGEEVFRADLYPATAANPFVTFYTTATDSGKLEFAWTGDNGFSETASATITVE